MTKPTVEVVCELSGVDLTAKQAKTIERVLSAVVGELWPTHRVRGLWVHKRLEVDSGSS